MFRSFKKLISMQMAALILTKMKLGCSRPYINPTPVPTMPTGLVELMEGLSREVIKNNPSDLYNFCAEHMNKLLELRDGRPPKMNLNLNEKITVAKNIVKQRAEQRRINYDKNMEKYISQIDLMDNKSYEKCVSENEFHHADKNCTTVISNVIQSAKKDKNDGLKSNDSDIISSQVGLADETLIEKEVKQTVVEECDINSTEVGSADSSIEDTDSVRVLSNEINIKILPDNNKNMGDFTNADENYPKDGNNMELSEQEDAFDFSNITEEKVKIDFGNNIVLDNELDLRPNLESKIDAGIDGIRNFEVASNITDISTTSNMKTCTEKVEEINANIKSNVLNGETLDINQDKSNDTLSNTVDNNVINHNLKENITCSSEITKTNTEFDIVNKEKNMPLLKVGERTEMINTSSVHDEITYSDTKTDEVKSNNMIALEINAAEVHDMTVTELAAVDSVASEEAAKNNNISQSNEEAHDVTIAKRVDSYGSQEEALKNILIVQRETENIEEINIDKNIQNEFNVVEENNLKSNLLDTNTISDLKINEQKSGALMELTTQDVQTIFSGPNENVDQAVIILNNHDSGVVTSNKHLNEHETDAINIKEELKVEPFIKNIENGDVSSAKKEYSQNGIDVEDFSTHDEYNSNNKQEHETTDTYNVNPMDLERAAITIQKVFRNFLFRSKTSSFDDSGNTEFNGFEREAGTKNEGTFANHHQNLTKDRRAVGINRMDTVLQTVNEEKSLSLSTDDSSTISSAATVIQAHIRGYLARNKFNRDKTASNTSLVDCEVLSATSLEGDSDLNKNKTVLNIHIVPEGGQFITRDESLLTSVELSLDGSPPTSAKLHPLGYDKNERRKQLKREDAIQSISPPSNNSRLSEEHDSVSEVIINDKNPQKEQTVDIQEPVDFQINNVTDSDDNVFKENDVKEPFQNKDSESAELVCKASEYSTDESDVVTPFKSTEEKNSDTDNMKLLHSGEFHDLVLPTKVSRSDTEVVSDFSNVLVYFLVWKNS